MDARIKAFLDLIAWSEGTCADVHPLTVNDGYDVIVTGVNGPQVFTDYSTHPFENGGSVTVKRVPLLVSTAAGRYQLLARYWRAYRTQLHLQDFSPASQDAVTLQQMRERGALSYLRSDNPQVAIQGCANIWASLPGNNYGQGGHSMTQLLARYALLMAR